MVASVHTLLFLIPHGSGTLFHFMSRVYEVCGVTVCGPLIEMRLNADASKFVPCRVLVAHTSKYKPFCVSVHVWGGVCGARAGVCLARNAHAAQPMRYRLPS